MIAPTVDLRVATWLEDIEGGLSAVPGDRGGITFVGITAPAAATLKNVDGSYVFDVDGDGDVDAADIRALADMPSEQRSALVGRFYERQWVETGASKLQWPCSLLAFDGAIHSGPRVGVSMLQKAINRSGNYVQVSEDGIVGSKTVAACRLVQPKALVDAYHRIRSTFLVDIVNKHADQTKFFHGWMNRVRRLADLAENP